MPVLTVERPLKQALGDDGADSLIRLLNQVQKGKKEDVLEFAEEKFKRRLSEKISKINERMTSEVGSLKVEMYKNQTNLFMWLFISLFVQFIVILGFVILFFK